MTHLPSHDIRERIAALDALVIDLGSDFDVAAERAVAGNADAGKEASRIDDRLSRLATDRKILTRALERSEAAERAAVEGAAETERQAHMATAREHAARLIEVAAGIDHAVSVLADALPAIAATEAALRRSLYLARHDYSTGVRGRAGLQVMAVDALRYLTDGRHQMRGPATPMAETISLAWAFLIEEQNDD